MTVVGGYGSVITSDGDSSLVNDGEGGAVYEDGSVSIVNEGDGTALVSRGVQSIEVDAEQRAQAVLDALEQDGVAALLEAEGFGETRPVAPNENEDGLDNPAGRQLNRRVEIYVPAF
ncbi:MULTISPECIES: OmpA family protein [unclassified Actinomyces]|uniref:OmpA family protein n=1 Tax=unclassified Actinomyces TaxID=2609248 RepID=UPI000D596A47|nr:MULTISPECIES: OmpA family protein [unclassified Actinomyces]RAX22738.1 OmpA family protein [Actinomyces sp. Z3]